ncbi:MAG: hypothetical protein JWO43_579 [Candidatus Adlerbacteria bacterium]|nr:hypothetical protein [Candidatus Adlerbacteria bacterium]
MTSKKLQPYFLLALIGLALLLAWYIFSPFVVVLAMAAVFGVVLYPLYVHLLRFVKWEGVAALLTILVGVVCILAPLTYLSFSIAREATGLYASLSDGSGQTYLYTVAAFAQDKINAHFPGFSSVNIPAAVDAYAKTALSWLAQHLAVVFSGIASLAFSIVIFLVSLYYMLRDGSKLKKAIFEISLLDNKDNAAIFDRLQLGVNSVIKGSLTVALIQGTLTGIGFTLFGIPNSILWGVVAMMTALIPGVGTALVLVPGIVYLFITGNTGAGIGLTVWGVAGVGLIDNFLGPRLVSHGIQLHPLIVLLSVFGGIGFFGAAGVFLGPLCISLLFGLVAVYAKLSKNLPE